MAVQLKEGTERRQHVRVRPTADYEIRACLVQGEITEMLPVVDLSVGGLKLLLTPALGARAVGEVFRLELSSPRDPLFFVSAELRYRSASFGICGVQFIDNDDTAQRALRRAVGDLMERGSLA